MKMADKQKYKDGYCEGGYIVPKKEVKKISDEAKQFSDMIVGILASRLLIARISTALGHQDEKE